MFVREEEVEEAFLVADVFGDDAFAGGVVAFDVAVIAAEVVDAERTKVIKVGLAIRHRIVEPEGMIEAGLEVASEQFVTGGIVAFRALDRNTVFRDIREAKPEVVGLDEFVGGTLRPHHGGSGGMDFREEAAGGIAGLHVRVYLMAELMLDAGARLDSGKALLVGLLALAACVPIKPFVV